MPQIDLAVAGGLNQTLDERWLDTSHVRLSTNTISVKAQTIEKRPGWIQYSNASGQGPTTGGSYLWFPNAIAKVSALYPDQAFAAVSDSEYLYGYNGGNWQWKDFAPTCVAVRRPISNAVQQPINNPDVAEYAAGGLRVFVWNAGATANDTAEIQYAIRDTSNRVVMSGCVINGITNGGDGSFPRVLIMGTFAVCVFQSEIGIRYVSLNLATLSSGEAWGTLGTLILTANWAGTAWDMVTQDGGAAAVLAYEGTTGPNYLNLATYTFSVARAFLGVATTVVTGETGQGFASVGLRWPNTPVQSGQDIAVIYSRTYVTGGGVNAYVAIFRNDLTTQFSGPTAIGDTTVREFTLTSINWVPSTATWIAVASNTISTVPYTVWRTVTTGGSVGNECFGNNLSLASRVFPVATRDAVYPCRMFAMMRSGWFQTTQYLVELDMNTSNNLASVVQQSPRPVATVAPRISTVLESGITSGFMARPVNVTNIDAYASSPTKFVAPCFVVTSSESNQTDLELWEATFDFAHPGIGQSVQVGPLTYMGGGVPSTFDGATVAEIGTLYEPNSQLHGVTAGGSSAGVLLAGYPYSWIYVYEWRDKAGNRVQGQPSLPTTVTMGGSTGGSAFNAVLTIPCNSLTRKGLAWRSATYGDAEQYIVPYRTAVLNGSVTAGVYYRVPNLDAGGSFQNIETNSALTVIDNNADTQIQFNETLYTTGGVLESDCPSSFVDICSHQQRVYGIGDDMMTIWISTTYVPGTPCYFNDGSQMYIPDMGELVAIWSMDDKLFFASSTAIGYVVGSGPNIVGAQSDLSPPVRIPTDVGVIDPRAVCVTQIGTVFRHAYGLGLLDRSLSVHSDFGDPVTDTLSGATVTAIVEHPTRPEILFYFVAGSGGTSGVLSYNYRFSSWSQWQITDPFESSGFANPQSAIVTSAGNVLTGNDVGNLWREKTPADVLQYYDTSAAQAGGSAVAAWVPMTVWSSWLKAGGPDAPLQGFGMVREIMPLFLVQDWCGWSASLYYDYSTIAGGGSWGQSSAMLSANPDVGGSVGTITRFHIDPAQQSCSTLSVRISDLAPGGSPTAVTGQGLRIVGITATVDPHPGVNRVPAAQRG